MFRVYIGRETYLYSESIDLNPSIHSEKKIAFTIDFYFAQPTGLDLMNVEHCRRMCSSFKAVLVDRQTNECEKGNV